MPMFAIPAALAIAGAATTAIAASRQNHAIGQAAGSQREQAALQQAHITRAAALQIQQVGEQAALETLRLKHETEQIMGRLRVTAADAGTGMGGSFQALSRQAFVDQALNAAIVQHNYENSVLRIRSDSEAAG